MESALNADLNNASEWFRTILKTKETIEQGMPIDITAIYFKEAIEELKKLDAPNLEIIHNDVLKTDLSSLTEDKFNILLLGYKEIRKIDDNFFEKLDFYSLFDSYTSLWWSASKNKTDSDFYRTNYAIVMKYLGVLNEKGNI